MQIEERGIMSDKTSAKIGVVACALLLLIVVFVAGFSIYKHMKADNIDGFGTLTVDHCEHIGPWDFNYRCYGSWQQGAGLVLQPQAMVDVVGVYKKDDMIPDVYPASSSDAQKISTSGPVDVYKRQVWVLCGEVWENAGCSYPPFGVISTYYSLPGHYTPGWSNTLFYCSEKDALNDGAIKDN